MAEENKEMKEQGLPEQGIPETLEDTLGKTEEFFEENKGIINKVLIGVILVLGGYIVMKKMVWEPAEVASQEELFQAQYLFEKDSFGLARESFEEIASTYSGTKAGNVANLYLGISLMKQGSFEEAIDALESFDGSGQLLPFISEGLLADCYSETGDYEKAVSIYKGAANVADSKAYSSYYLKKAGLLLEQNGEAEKAAKLYQKILDKYFYEDIPEYKKDREEIVTLLSRAKSA